jgi:hypothetical protein
MPPWPGAIDRVGGDVRHVHTGLPEMAGRSTRLADAKAASTSSSTTRSPGASGSRPGPTPMIIFRLPRGLRRFIGPPRPRPLTVPFKSTPSMERRGRQFVRELCKIPAKLGFFFRASLRHPQLVGRDGALYGALKSSGCPHAPRKRAHCDQEVRCGDPCLSRMAGGPPSPGLRSDRSRARPQG